MIFGNNSQRNIKRAGWVTTLAATMILTLAACGGTPTPAVQTTATPTDTGAAAPVETTVANEPLATTVAEAPGALPTEGSDAGEVVGIEGDAATPTQSPEDTSGATTATPPADQGTSPGDTTEIQGTLREWAIDLSQQEVPAGKVVFIVTNQGQHTHNFTVEDSTGVIGRTPNFTSADGVQTLELELAPGTYNIICSLPGHAARGQQTQLVVK